MTPRSRISASAAKTVSTRVGDEAERRLVEQQHVGRGDERAADRELLLLAAGERPCLATAEVGEHREELVGRGERVRAVAAAASREPEPQVLLHR